MAQAEDDLPDPLTVELPELVVDEGLTRHVQQALGRFARQRSQPGRQTAGQDRDREPTHAITALVPSKSNRNRTSSSPSSAIN